MSVDPATAKHRAEHAGATYYFCCAGCRGKFVADPARYLRSRLTRRRAPCMSTLTTRRSAPAPTAELPGAIYTCPMHPQIRQDHPGACPICGMALEPEVATEATGPSAELVDMTRRFWIALALSIPVFALEMGGHLAGLHRFVPEGAFQLDSVGARDAGRALGGLAVLRARLGVAQEPQSQHVHADRHGRRRRLGLQRRRHRRAGPLPGGVPRRPWRGGRLFRSRRRSSRRWFCSARCWS